MNDHELELLSDEEKIKLLETEKDDQQRAFIIRAFSCDELKLKYIHLVLEDDNKSSVTYRMTDEENKIKIIDMMQDEKWITAAVMELKTDRFKIKYLEKVNSFYYKNCILESLKVKSEELAEIIELVEDEKVKILIIARIEDKDKKRSYLDSIKDINCRSRIVMTLDDEDLKMEYIDQVDDLATKTLLITSLKDKGKRDSLLGIQNNEYSNISLPDGLTVGIEIECEGLNSSDAYVVDKIIPGWKGIRDGSLEEGVEVVSPILTNTEGDTKDIYAVCKVLQDIGQETSERCGGHIHIGANYLKSKEAFVNLIELWSNNEEIFFILSNKNGEITRESVATFAPPLSKKIKEEIDADKFANFDDLSKEEFIEIIKTIKANADNRETRRASINFDNVGNEEKNTIEFRLSNGTIDANTWIENANLFGGLVAISQRISDIQHKDIYEITADDKSILQKFTRLKNRELSNEERLDMLLDLCVPDEYKQIYIDRYVENSQLLEQNIELKEKLEGFISTKPIDFYVRGVATQQTYSSVESVESVLVSDFLEFENPTQIQDKSVSLDD